MVPGGIGHYSYHLPRLCPRVGPTLLSLTKPVSTPSFIYLLAVPHGLWDLRILVLRSGIELAPPAVEGWSLNHWTTGEVPCQVNCG